MTATSRHASTTATTRRASTRPANSRVQHGEAACAEYGCRREECLQARRYKQKLNKLLRQTGRPGLVDSHRAAAHITKFRAASIQDKDIIKTMGVARNTFYRALRGLPISRGVEQRILAVPAPRPVAEVSIVVKVSATATHRRLQALLWKGWPLSVLEQRLGVHVGWIGRSMRRRKTVTAVMEARVAALYDELWKADPEQGGVHAGVCRSTREAALRNGFHGPGAWDDDTIGDPDAVPYSVDGEDFADEAAKPLHEADVDQVVVARFMEGFRLEQFTDAEFLTAVRQCAAAGMACPDIDVLRGWSKKTTENRLNRLRKQYERAGWAFPDLGFAKAPAFTEQQVVDIRERSAAGTPDVQLAVAFDVTRETIRSIVRGQRYAQYGGPIRGTRSAKSLKASREYMCGHAANAQAALNQNKMEVAA